MFLFKRTAILAGLMLSAASVQAGNYTDAQVRAVFLYNFASFVSWPDTTFDSDASPFNYCVPSESPSAASIREVVAGEYVDKRPMQLLVRTVKDSLEDCHVLYVSQADVQQLAALGQVQRPGLLTVTDDSTDTGLDAVIRLEKKSGRIHPVINRALADQRGLRISSKLLRVATIVGVSG